MNEVETEHPSPLPLPAFFSIGDGTLPTLPATWPPEAQETALAVESEGGEIG